MIVWALFMFSIHSPDNAVFDNQTKHAERMILPGSSQKYS